MELNGLVFASGVDFEDSKKLESLLEALPDDFLDSDKTGIEVSCNGEEVIIQPLKGYNGNFNFPKRGKEGVKMNRNGTWFSHSGNKYWVRPYKEE